MGLFKRTKKKDETVDQMKLLLDVFDFNDLLTFCNNVVGEEPILDEEHLSKTQILDFIWEKYYKQKLSFSQLKDYALKHGIIEERFFE